MKGILSKGVIIRCVFLMVLIFAAKVMAEDALSFYVENDSRLIKPINKTDRHYTNGMKLVYLTQPDWQWLKDFSSWDIESDQHADTAVGFFIGQNIYTPDYPNKPLKRKPEDMQFAGWLYTGLFAQRATDHRLDHIELNLGVIGPSAKADEVQSNFHDWIRSDEAIGWDTQIGDEFAADFTYMREQRLLDGWFAPTGKTDFIAEYGFTAGSVHRHAQAGLTFRYGFNLGNTFGPGRLEQPSGISTFRKTDKKSGYLFARAAVRAVEHNRFLTGLSTEPLVGQFQAGAVYQYKKLELGYSQTFFTQEFKQQSGTDSIGVVTVSWKF